MRPKVLRLYWDIIKENLRFKELLKDEVGYEILKKEIRKEFKR